MRKFLVDLISLISYILINQHRVMAKTIRLIGTYARTSSVKIIFLTSVIQLRFMVFNGVFISVLFTYSASSRKVVQFVSRRAFSKQSDVCKAACCNYIVTLNQT